MKKFTYLLAVAAVFTACNSGNNGYTVTGTVEGAADGDTVYLETVEGRQFVKLDSAVIKVWNIYLQGYTRYCCQPLHLLQSRRKRRRSHRLLPGKRQD